MQGRDCGLFTSLSSYSYKVVDLGVWFAVQWVMPHGVMDMLTSCQGQFGCHQNIEIWKAVT